jgi:hypothetical protein
VNDTGYKKVRYISRRPIFHQLIAHQEGAQENIEANNSGISIPNFSEREKTGYKKDNIRN